MAISFLAVQELNQRYNDDPRSFTDEEAEMIARLSQQFGLDFQRTSRPLAKGAFDFADIATFGMLPNRWRPESRGESVYGETTREKIAGGVGSVLGIPAAIGTAYGAGKGLLKGGQAAFGALRGGGGTSAAGEVVRKSAEGIRRTGRGLLDATKTAGGRAAGIGRNLGQAGRNLGQAGATYGQLGIEQAATALARRLGISIAEAKRLLAGTGIAAGAGSTALGLNALLSGSEEPNYPPGY